MMSHGKRISGEDILIENPKSDPSVSVDKYCALVDRYADLTEKYLKLYEENVYLLAAYNRSSKKYTRAEHLRNLP